MIHCKIVSAKNNARNVWLYWVYRQNYRNILQ